MNFTLPGTVLPFDERKDGKYVKVISPIFTTLKGVSLSQVKELTNLTSATIQNWVKRGYIPKPQNKRYGKSQVLRIILINSIKGGMQIEDVQKIMVYINGDVEDTSDDIISDEDLYNRFCRAIKICEKTGFVDENSVKNAVSKVLEDYIGTVKNSKQRLSKALNIMVYAYVSARLRDISKKELKKILS
ncbi:MAG: DUF1836 domain-containing protein [Acutalibacteraceae bacterium]